MTSWKYLDPLDWTYTLCGTPFSTIELNHNILFKCHADGNNVAGTCVCITTLGLFVGGRACLPSIWVLGIAKKSRSLNLR